MIERFGAYAMAFEQVMTSDDWSAIEPFFTEEAVYDSDAAVLFGGRWEGRAAVLAALKESLDGFDRRCDSRTPEIVEGPVEKDGGVWVRFRVVYTVSGAPDLVLEGEETARFEGDRIRHLQDRYTDEMNRTLTAWYAEHGAKLQAT
jgi:hypothetical protein